MPKNNRVMIAAAALLIVIIGLLWIATPPNQLPGGLPGVSDDETSR
jgi:hypothetical protein